MDRAKGMSLGIEEIDAITQVGTRPVGTSTRSVLQITDFIWTSYTPTPYTGVYKLCFRNGVLPHAFFRFRPKQLYFGPCETHVFLKMATAAAAATNTSIHWGVSSALFSV